MKRKAVIPPFVPNYPDMTVCGEDEYIMSWRIKDWDMIHRIQEYFGMQRYTTVNRLSKVTMKKTDPKWNDLLDGLRKGLYWLYKVPNVSKSEGVKMVKFSFLYLDFYA